MKIIFLLILSALLLNGCIDCGPQQELTIQLSIQAFPDTLLLKKITSPGAIDQSVFEEQTKNYSSKSYYAGSFDFTLPISLNADSTTYIFEFENRTDTLSLFYSRDFFHKDGCGFVVDAKRPASLTETKSTFKDVYVDYQSYILDGKVPVFGIKDGQGITVLVSL
ncbi:hypothetical protein [Dyadobacter sp. CY356]|uniref:hypothetical protein n=1 Tax=Dyadobacter sp. CY356 TaxID=2906442 RepID=UPI001F21FC81|nr:hypothetical protein [Dyadobacter sp. CY356]MCF0056717.1 hypothetical protein [Dyadobacter sp. CY356]